MKYKNAVTAVTQIVDAERGTVLALPVVAGVIDDAGDMIAANAITRSLQRRHPKVVWSHQWTEPVARVTDAREITSTDPAMPADLRRAGVSALLVRCSFNLETQRGQDALSDLGFFPDLGWSIGYVTGAEHFDKALGANVIDDLTIYECSPCLFGANEQARTLAVIKSLDRARDRGDRGDRAAGVLDLIELLAESPSWDKVTRITVNGWAS